MAMDLEKKENPDLEEDGAAAPQSVEAESGAAEWPEDGQDQSGEEGGKPLEWFEDEDAEVMEPVEDEDDGAARRSGKKKDGKARRSGKKEDKAMKRPGGDFLKNLFREDPFDALFAQLFGDKTPDRNLPNQLTIARIVLIPVFMAILYWGFPGATYVALLVFIIASLTDLFDGKLARKYHLVTDFGKFADPLADKMLVTAAMLWFVEIGKMPAWALAIVICREFAVSGLRMLAADKGRVIAAGWSGKVKTAATMVCVILMFFPLADWLNMLCVAVITLTTLYSGVEYFLKNKDVLAGM